MPKKKTLKFSDEVFQFEVSERGVTIINQSEFQRLHSFFRRKITTLIHNRIVAKGIYIHGMSQEDFLQEMDCVLVESLNKYDEKKAQFTTLVYSGCYNKLTDIFRSKLHTRELAKYKGTRCHWIADQIEAVNFPGALDPIYNNNNNDTSDFDTSNNAGLIDKTFGTPELYNTLANYLLRDLL